MYTSSWVIPHAFKEAEKRAAAAAAALQIYVVMYVRFDKKVYTTVYLTGKTVAVILEAATGAIAFTMMFSSSPQSQACW